LPREPEYRAIHDAADKVEPRLARALVRHADRLRRRVPVRELVRAIELGDARRADAVLSDELFEDALEPSAAILADAFVRAAELTAEELNEELDLEGD
jgi:hypothetical protein